MESINPMQSPTKKPNYGRDRDRISKLPDHILHHILSFLMTRDVVKTSILSQRWKDLWVSIPYLFFEEPLIFPRQFELSFDHFVNMVLLRRDASVVHTFRIHWYRDFDLHHFDIWIRYAVNHNVKLLEIDVDEGDEAFYLPDCVFTCQSMEGFSLSCRTWLEFRPPEFTRLDRLKRLHITFYEIEPDSMEKILSGCPVLEDLELDYCILTTPDSSSLTMKTLTIIGCVFNGTAIRISCPNLLALHYINNGELNIFLEDLPSLLNASIYVHNDLAGVANEIDIIRKLSNAKTLEFLSPRIEFISDKELSELPTFHNLKRLALGGWRMNNNFQAVVYFLQHSPNLEILTLKEDVLLPSWECIHINTEEASRRELPFDCPHLKIVEIRLKRSKENERVHEMVKNLLANARISEIHSKSRDSTNC